MQVESDTSVSQARDNIYILSLVKRSARVNLARDNMGQFPRK